MALHLLKRKSQDDLQSGYLNQILPYLCWIHLLHAIFYTSRVFCSLPFSWHNPKPVTASPFLSFAHVHSLVLYTSLMKENETCWKLKISITGQHGPQGFQTEITGQNCKVGREQLGHNKCSHVGKVSKWVTQLYSTAHWRWGDLKNCMGWGTFPSHNSDFVGGQCILALFINGCQLKINFYKNVRIKFSHNVKFIFFVRKSKSLSCWWIITTVPGNFEILAWTWQKSICISLTFFSIFFLFLLVFLQKETPVEEGATTNGQDIKFKKSY